ncbi:hypothetical protein CBR_g60506 [Chara braunii]|uniref:Uncharacterized protein n=1 Tax=Chara braunii TaxID=69332 RepID=A0A388MF60_CHABU|nr:hypothetical protein CBR_g60506 [Chara braunii]|eukprot:GBG93206.1 hypothetical protein CBR_g60506 [Chara braunii]
MLTGCRIIVSEQKDPAFLPSPYGNEKCFIFIQNIVYGPGGKHIYYVVHQFCEGPDEKRTKEAMSYLEADLTSVSEGVGAVGSLATTRLISHWWPALIPNGPPPLSAVVFVPQTGMPYMALGWGTEISKNGTHLLLSAASYGPSDPSWVVALNIANGSRSSIPITVALANGLTFNPTKTKMYVCDMQDPAKILEGAVIDPDVPTRLVMTTVVEFGPLSGYNVSSPAVGPYSFSGDGSCLYFFDEDYRRLWTFQTVSRVATLIAVGSNDTAVPLTSSALRVPVEGGLTALAVSSNGVNVFFTTSWGELFLITMSEPCGTPLMVEELAEHPTESFSGLAIHEADGKLLVGTGNGLVLEFTTTLLPSGPSASTPSPPYTSSAAPQPPMSRSVPTAAPPSSRAFPGPAN